MRQTFRRNCSVASAPLQAPGVDYQDELLADCRKEPEKRDRDRDREQK